jgi:hypothetical protein
LLPNILKVLCIYFAVWAGEFINSGCFEWWGFCVIVDNLYGELLFVLVVTFTLLCPHNFVTCLTQALYIESYTCLVWKWFPIFCRYLCAMFGVVLLVNFIINSKVKCTLVQALRLCPGRTAHRGSRGIDLPFHDHGTRRGWGVSVMPRLLFTPGKTWYPLYRRLGGPQSQSRQVQKISPPPGFDPWTVQPLASRCSNYATWPKFYHASDVFIIYCRGVGFLFVCLSELLSGNLSI